jgi:hypothetical protein
MSTDPRPTGPAPTRPAHGRRYKRRELGLPDGGSLVLETDGSITQRDPEGVVAHAWTPDDPDWASRAIRFGLHPQEATVPPTGRVEGRYPPRR